MEILNLVNKERQLVAKVVRKDANDISIDVLEPSLQKEIVEFIEKARETGIPFRTGIKETRDGKEIFIEKILTVKPDDELFLRALADSFTKVKLGGQRIYGLIEKK